MTEELSGSQTAYTLYRYGGPLGVATFSVGGAILLGGPLPFRLGSLVLGFGIGIALHLYFRQFKRVALVDSCLIVSDAERVIHVPLGAVENVTQSWSMNPTTVVLILRSPCPFGRRILFIPAEPGTFPPWLTSATVAKIRRLSRTASATCDHARAGTQLKLG